MKGIFRKQAVEAQKNRLHGEISLAQPLSIYLTSSIIISVIIAITLFFSFASYARKETVRGYIVPDKGVIKTYAERSGNVESLHVSEGDFVEAGQPLATVILNRGLVSGGDLSEVLIGQLLKQKELLIDEQQTNKTLEAQELNRLEVSLLDLTKSINVIDKLNGLLNEKLLLQQEQLTQHNRLFEDGHLSTLEHQFQQEKLLSVRQEIENLASSRVKLVAELNTTKAQLSATPNQYSLKQADISSRISSIERQLDEAKNSHRYVIRAIETGTITSIQVVEGEYLVTNRPLMSMIPQGAILVAELLVPTRSAGFVKLGDLARLRFDAFPYQRFGFLQSEVTRIDKALLLSGEANLPFQLSEPVYRIRTSLSEQSMLAYGDSFPLKSGMLLEADIILDSRSLLDWLLDPIYSLNGRVS